MIRDLINNLNNAKILQTTYLGNFIYDENFPRELSIQLDEFTIKEIDFKLNVEKHRWYEISTNVYELTLKNKRYLLGIRGASQSYNEMSSWIDFSVTYKFMEMEETKIISYKIKVETNE